MAEHHRLRAPGWMLSWQPILGRAPARPSLPRKSESRLNTFPGIPGVRGLFSPMILLHPENHRHHPRGLAVFQLDHRRSRTGHFLAARWRGLVIEKFGIWFGKPLWKKKIGGVNTASVDPGGWLRRPAATHGPPWRGKASTPAKSFRRSAPGQDHRGLRGAALQFSCWRVLCDYRVAGGPARERGGEHRRRGLRSRRYLRRPRRGLLARRQDLECRRASGDRVSGRTVGRQRRLERRRGEGPTGPSSSNSSMRRARRDQGTAGHSRRIRRKTMVESQESPRASGRFSQPEEPSRGAKTRARLPPPPRPGLPIDIVIKVGDQWAKIMMFPTTSRVWVRDHPRGPVATHRRAPPSANWPRGTGRWNDDLKTTKLTLTLDPRVSSFIAGVARTAPASRCGSAAGRSCALRG